MVINSQGNRLAAVVGYPATEIKLWKLDTGEQVADYTGHTEQLNGLAFSPDGHSLASSSDDGTVKIWLVP